MRVGAATTKNIRTAGLETKRSQSRELLPDRLRITTGLYRPKIHTEEIDFNTVESVRVEGFRLYRIVNRGDVVLMRAGGLNPVRIEGIKDPEGIKTLIDGALERWRPRLV